MFMVGRPIRDRLPCHGRPSPSTLLGPTIWDRQQPHRCIFRASVTWRSPFAQHMQLDTIRHRLGPNLSRSSSRAGSIAGSALGPQYIRPRALSPCRHATPQIVPATRRRQHTSSRGLWTDSCRAGRGCRPTFHRCCFAQCLQLYLGSGRQGVDRPSRAVSSRFATRLGQSRDREKVLQQCGSSSRHF